MTRCVAPQALLALQRRLEVESPPGVWIAIAGRAFVETQVERSKRAPRAAATRARRRAMPLFGVPFAVKDNIDVAGLADHRRLPGFAYTPPPTRTRSRS